LNGPSRIDQIYRLGSRLLERIQTQVAAVTLDQDGAIVFERGRMPLRTFTEPNPHTQAAGAGDTYVAGMALALASGADAATAAEIAAAAAAIVVKNDGTSCCSLSALTNRLAGREEINLGLEILLPYLDQCRSRGQRIVLTNGCFDILHRGHITYLNQARGLGDLLVVGLNTDASIRRLKGPERPINTLEDRMQVLVALQCVDHVIPFDEDTPHRLVKTVRPHVFVKGGDYTRDRLPEAALVEEMGGRVEILPLVSERSTTKLIGRIRAVEGGATGLSNVVAPADPVTLPYGSRIS
jgi:D-beta-D-heptose 7-phosphate kinase/D-beta-D-heptose 1-phosphate adenosyltransferase